MTVNLKKNESFAETNDELNKNHLFSEVYEINYSLLVHIFFKRLSSFLLFLNTFRSMVHSFFGLPQGFRFFFMGGRKLKSKVRSNRVLFLSLSKLNIRLLH